MKKIAVSVLCRCCRNRKYLREGAEVVPVQNKTVAVKWNKKEISGPILGQYREPCKIFERGSAALSERAGVGR